MVEKMLAWDLADVPPARANVTKDALGSTPNVLLIQSIKTVRHHRRLMPDITTWVQCFSIYTSVLATKHPQHVPELMAYMRDIIRASKQFKWPAGSVYDTIASSWQKQNAKIGPK